MILQLLWLWLGCLAAWPDPNLRTRGQIWPQPQSVRYYDVVRQISTNIIVKKNLDCDIVNKALKRYGKILGLNFEMDPIKVRNEKNAISSLHIDVIDTNCAEYPDLGADECYSFTANTTNVYLRANQVWGVLRGLESFSQLFFYKDNVQCFQSATIDNDHPRFPHRGLLLDTSRHYFSLKMIKAIIELMAMNKMNVFHWHLVDMEAFPYIPEVYPEFGQGAYDRNHTYTREQVKVIIEFARLRGVRVLPELDTPGHVASWGKGFEFMTSRCFNRTSHKMGVLDRGMLNVSNQKMWTTLIALFKELMTTFPDKYFHLGGDETIFWKENCWANNDDITEFMKTLGLKTVKDLEKWYFEELFANFSHQNMPKKSYIVWQEVINMEIKLPEGMVAHVWMGNRSEVLKNITAKGFQVLLSECWYLDLISPTIDYLQYYMCDPQVAQ